MGSGITMGTFITPRDFRAERKVDLSWRPLDWWQRTREERRDFKQKRLEQAMKYAYEDGNADVATDLLQTYIATSAEYQKNDKGRYTVHYGSIEISGLWDCKGGGDGRGYSEVIVNLLSPGVRKQQGATFNSEYARDDKGNTDRTILSFMGNIGFWDADNKECNKVEESIAYNLIQLSGALASGEAKFEFKPFD